MNASPVSVMESAGSLAITGVCLDVDTYMSLSQFLAMQPGGRVAANLSQYAGAEREAARALENGATRVCLVDLDTNAEEANRVIERLQAEYPDILIFAVSGSTDTEQIIAAMRNGCTDFLTKPIRHEALNAALRRAEVKQRERNHKNKNRGKVISVIGAKGGTGVTTIALHLSLALARETGKKCLLVDQHPGLGDASLYLGATRHKYSFYELAASSDRLDEELLHGFVLHHDSGLDLLDSPESVDFSAYATAAAIEQTISFLADSYQYIVVDCPPGLSDATVSTLSQSDQIAIVLTAELPAVRNAVRYTDYLSKMGISPSSFYLVLNRYTKKAPLGEERLQKTLQHPIRLRVPEAYQDIVRSINAGTPIEPGRKSEFGMSLSSWCQELIAEFPAEDAPARKPQGKLSRLLSI